MIFYLITEHIDGLFLSGFHPFHAHVRFFINFLLFFLVYSSLAVITILKTSFYFNSCTAGEYLLPPMLFISVYGWNADFVVSFGGWWVTWLIRLMLVLFDDVHLFFSNFICVIVLLQNGFIDWTLVQFVLLYVAFYHCFFI